jgi:hypothetical protein
LYVQLMDFMVAAVALVAAPLAAEVLPAARVYRIGILSVGTTEDTAPLLSALEERRTNKFAEARLRAVYLSFTPR